MEPRHAFTIAAPGTVVTAEAILNDRVGAFGLPPIDVANDEELLAWAVRIGAGSDAAVSYLARAAARAAVVDRVGMDHALEQAAAALAPKG